MTGGLENRRADCYDGAAPDQAPRSGRRNLASIPVLRETRRIEVVADSRLTDWRPPPLASHPFVSVILPVRNEARRLARCLEAILAQEYPADRLEIIVVDGS